MAQGTAAATLDELISLSLKRGERKTHCVFLPAVFGFFPGASIHWRKNLNLPRAAFSSSQILEPLALMRLVSLIVGFDTSHYKGCCFFLFFCTFVYFTGWYLITWNHVRSIYVKLESNCGLWKLNLMIQKLNFMIFVVWVRPLCWPKKSARMLLRLRAMWVTQ